MKLCDICHKNVAIIFTAKIENGKSKMIGLCAKCAEELGVSEVNKLIGDLGVSSKDTDGLTEKINNIFKDISSEEIKEIVVKPEEIDDKKVFGRLIENIFGLSEDEDYLSEKIETEVEYKKVEKKRMYLDTYGINLNQKAISKKIDKVVGRKKEIDRVIKILNRRTKNNPVLIGEPGVGKTAIAEYLAIKIVEKQVPLKLLNAEVYLLDLTSVVAGTQFRGQFESRMKNIIKEVKEDGNIILVIDEIHSIVGVGDINGGAMNAANILKPALANGDIRVVGTTTLDEYRKFIEKDSALERRFQTVIIEEPTIEETIKIIKGIKEHYEDYHKVKIPNKVIETAVKMSKRYITDRFLPDKAIDIIDEASSSVNLKNKNFVKLEELKNELLNLREKMKVAAKNTDYKKAAEYKVNEYEIQEEIENMKDKCKSVKLTEEDIAFVIEDWTNIPVKNITEKETEKLLKLEENLHKRVIGQNEAVTSISKAIRRNRLGFKKRKKPASFMFVGPTGVGKTELVRALSCELFGDEKSLIRIDMSEYMEKHTVAKLIGAPPGYVGYDEGGQLTEKVRRKPYSIILFDEIEKAHSDVFNMLLQILEDGRLTDSQGRTVFFENTIVIMTSNSGTSFKNPSIGFAQENYNVVENKVRESLKEHFRPEFLNRLDEIIVFKSLKKEELSKIIDIMLKEVEEEIKSKNITMEVSQKVKDFILKIGYNEKYGARPLRRTIQKYIEDEITEQYLQKKFNDGDHIKLDLIDEKIIIEI
ncbi:negative regulator of genetic competence ClpC/MecB [Clostridium acetireducens DSM 10703]|jgi:ATP-dependent Clp protease ATP-binding subunit ClpA|uniref:Negative regulator of genetic competence ClpC/MecB n=1 Tax=Clostridium acetireducens DSM 10703 TaxID=1121290 RepID=A0A1E8EYD0_9CLOT|nr:ATP-dependent Clp protease ATP-binding subunit [Clostridium acetireducens]OFI05837.1 negative regulator of genetic competence ClpC/MecB [Clostridium acetireducens DSM 10703]